MIELPERNEPDLKRSMDVCRALLFTRKNTWRNPAYSLSKVTNVLPHFQCQPTVGNQAKDAVHNLSTASVDKYFAALIPSYGDAKTQELVIACVCNAEETAGDEAENRVEK